jgi:GT2 family glycosyltransferase
VQLHGSNLGYAAGNNRAVDHAFAEMGAEWVCLLNSDVIVAADTFDLLLDGARAAEATGTGPVGAVGPCVLYRDRPEVIWANGGRVGLRINVTQLIDHNRRNKGGSPHDVDYLPGACLMISRAAWEATGPLDESFFCYLEDADWCVRLAETGQRVVVVPEAFAWHGVSISTGGGYSTGRKYMTAVNSVHFLKKHGSIGGWAALLFFDLLLWPLAFVRGVLTGRATATLAKLRGVTVGLLGGRVTAEVAARFARRAP